MRFAKSSQYHDGRASHAALAAAMSSHCDRTCCEVESVRAGHPADMFTKRVARDLLFHFNAGCAAAFCRSYPYLRDESDYIYVYTAWPVNIELCGTISQLFCPATYAY